MPRHATVRNVFLAAALGLAAAFAFADAVPAGEHHTDITGITVDSANANADRIRRTQSHDTGDINAVNEDSR